MMTTSCPLAGQEISEQQIENLTDATEAENEDDSYVQQLEHFKKRRLNLNTAEEDDLRELQLLTALQIERLLAYRNLLGHFINIYELQAVPSWDLPTIYKVLPYVTVAPVTTLREYLAQRIKGGEHILLLRLSQVLEKAKGYNKQVSGSRYEGSPQRIFFRYRYQYKNLLQWGITADKDAGERFFGGAQRNGFDFYSFHLFARHMGKITALAVGDYTVNMGQGLIHWQGLAFKKSTEVMNIKRQSPVLRPYSSAGEFNFLRGAGITMQLKDVSATTFVSLRTLSASRNVDSLQRPVVSSFNTSGLHRTTSEIANRNHLQQATAGVNFRYRKRNVQVGLNGIYNHFSLPVQKREEPYNLYAIQGNNWHNLSVDYSYTWKNTHWFGEIAIDKNLQPAFISGVLLSADPRVDISILHRRIAPSYQAVNGNAFTENTTPTNERGWYIGVAIRPHDRWRLHLYADFYQFPWLKYLTDAPGQGSDYAAQLTYTPNRRVEIYTRYRSESKSHNQSSTVAPLNYIDGRLKQQWRIQMNYTLSPVITIRQRVEMLWYERRKEQAEMGYLSFADLLYKPALMPYSLVLRLQFFETGSYNSRLYAYENDVLYSYSIPASFDKGARYYVTMSYDFSKRFSAWVRWAQTIYREKETIGSGLEEISGQKKSEIKLQWRYLF